MKLEAHIKLNILAKTVYGVADVIELAEKLGVRVDWINKTIGK